MVPTIPGVRLDWVPAAAGLVWAALLVLMAAAALVTFRECPRAESARARLGRESAGGAWRGRGAPVSQVVRTAVPRTFPVRLLALLSSLPNPLGGWDSAPQGCGWGLGRSLLAS